MKNFDILTLTVNPSLDKSTSFSGLLPEQKIRCETPHYDAGGGGINVSKAVSRLGGESLCIFTAGGFSGQQLKELIEKEGIATAAVPVRHITRENFIALDKHTNLQYRFGFPGLAISTDEVEIILSTIRGQRPKFIVASGSLHEGMPLDFYQKVAGIAKESGAKFVADTSGDPLKKILETGVYLLKPNIGELAKLIGKDKLETDEADEAARSLIEKGSAEIVVVSLGPQGAVLVTKEETIYVPAPNVQRKSTVGAGDSMVGGMVWALSQNKSIKEVVHWGVACGTAATMNHGTQLFRKEDALRLFDWLQKK
jgi:6-phosphofructokinase 2